MGVARSPTAYRFTVKDYHRMAEADVFPPDDRVELIDGEVLRMAPIGSRHAACVKRLARHFMCRVAERAIVGVQDPIQLSDLSEPQPDVALLRPRDDYYASGHPLPADVFLVIEVGELSDESDRATKLPLYLASGVPEVWVVDLGAEVVHMATGHGSRTVGRGDSLAPLAFPDVVLEVAAILG